MLSFSALASGALGTAEWVNPLWASYSQSALPETPKLDLIGSNYRTRNTKFRDKKQRIRKLMLFWWPNNQRKVLWIKKNRQKLIIWVIFLSCRHFVTRWIKIRWIFLILILSLPIWTLFETLNFFPIILKSSANFSIL